jgi:serine phosphatase RsbU (regulator of sigma subunit)
LISQNVSFSGYIYGFLGDKLVLIKKASKNVSFEGPISGVKISIKSLNGARNFDVTSDITGAFSFTIPRKDKYILSVSRDGYSSVSINLNYDDAGLKTNYLGFSFILKKGDNSINEIGDVLIGNSGKLYFTTSQLVQKKSNNEVMLSNKVLFEKTEIINNSSLKNIVQVNRSFKQKTSNETTTDLKETEITQVSNDNPLTKSIMSDINAIILDSVSSIGDLRNQLKNSKEALLQIDTSDYNYSILLTQIINAEHQIKTKELLIESQEKEISNSKKIIIFLSLLCVFVCLSILLLLYFLNQKKKYNLELNKVNKKVTTVNSRLLSSIRYASIIQSNFFKDKKLLFKLFPKCFIFNKPKDLLSGDFYWFSQKDNHKVLVVADCTGHGVPGSLLTILGHSLLEEIVNVKGEVLPSKILFELNKAIISAFSNNNQLEFGIDITVLSMIDGSDQVIFSGLTNGLYNYSNGELIYHKVSPKTIGTNLIEEDLINHTISIKSGDSIYMMSDGYCDQFGKRQDTFEKYNLLRMNKILNKISKFKNFDDCEFELNSDFEDWKGDREQTDDVIIVGIRF